MKTKINNIISLFKKIGNKDTFSKEKLEELLDKLQEIFSKDNLEKIIKKIKSIKKEDILLWYYSYRDKLFFYLFSSILFIVLIAFIVLVKNTYVTYQKLQNNVNQIAIINDPKLINLIKNNNLRIITSIVDSLYIKEYLTYNQKEYNKLYKNVIKEIIVDIYSSDSAAKFMLDSFFDTTNIISKKEKLQKILQKIDLFSVNQLQEFNNVLTLRKYLSSFPNLNRAEVLKYIKDKQLVDNTAKVLSKLYIYELPAISKFVSIQAELYKQKYLSNVAPYKNFLSYILLPSVNIWINPFSQVINPDIFGSEYLKKAGYIDLNLIKYWTDFFTISYKGKLYQWLNNVIEWIKLQKLNILRNNLALVWLNIKFNLIDEKSFYWLISKLTITSDIKNIVLINEFTYYLWNQIKQYVQQQLPQDFEVNKKLWTRWIAYQLYKCTQKFNDNCRKLFNCKWNCKLPSQINSEFLKNNVNLDDINSLLLSYFSKLSNSNYTNSSFYKFIKNEYHKINDWDKLVGARLYDCIKENGYCSDIFDKNYSQIANTIKTFAKCDLNKDIDFVCKYKFINKFNTNYFIAYTMVDKLGKINYSLLERLKDVYNNLPSILQLDKFTFTKNEKNNALAMYNANVGLSIFYKYLTQDEYNKILSYIGQGSCKSVTNWSSFDLWKALSYIKNKYNILSKWNVDAAKLYDLKELQQIIDNLQKESKKAKLLDKLLANLQVYRIFKERGYCK